MGQLFEQIQNRFSEIREFETTGLADLRAWSDVAADKPLFETVLVFENYPVEEGVAGNKDTGLNASLRSSFGYNSFPVTLMVHEMDGNLGLRLSYDCSRFSKGTIERVLQQVRRALAGLGEGNSKTLQELSFLTDGDLRASSKWNETDALIQLPKTLNEAFEARTAVNPHAQALLFQGADGKPQQMSYGHLNRMANRLAHFLGSRGIGPGSSVALLMGRTPWMVITRLAVWKSGAAFVPLDPAHPQERLNSVLQESEPDLLVVESANPGRNFNSDVVTVQLDDLVPELENQPHKNPDVAVDASFPAYMVHTSGSTGKPKGVVCHHGGAANYLDHVVGNFGLNHSDTVLQLAAPAFDASVRDTMAPLLVGARVILVGEGDAREPRALADAMVRHRVTCLASVVPSLLGLLLESVEQGCKPSLRLILSSGEPLHEGLVTSVKKILGPEVELVNQYGPTETTMTSTYFRTNGKQTGVVPLGQPIANSRVWVLWGGRPVPVGAVGEVFIAGSGLSSGYHGQPALTATRFLPDPIGREPGARIYRTGDLARFTGGSGGLQFLGRVDAQIKLRGVRIEPGDIEAALVEREDIRAAAVVVAKTIRTPISRLFGTC